MPAKRKEATASTKEAKQPPHKEMKKEPVCVAGLSSKQLASRFSYELSKAGDRAKDMFDQKFKGKQAAHDEEKREFMRQIILGEFDPDTFTKSKSNKFAESTSVDDEWMSWTKVVRENGLAVARAMVTCGTLESRPHTKVTNPDVLATLDEEDRKEYNNTTEKGKKKLTEESEEKSEQTVENSGSIVQDGIDGEKDVAKKHAKAIATIRKAHVQFAGQVGEYKTRMEKFVGNKYVQAIYEETSANLKTMMKLDKKVQTFLNDVAKDSTSLDEEIVTTNLGTANELKEVVSLFRERLAVMTRCIEGVGKCSTEKKERFTE